MGKQSSRLIYEGNDHKDIYFQGKYHKAMHLGSKLLWEKLPGEKFFLYRYNRTVDRVDYSNLRSFDVDSRLITDYPDYSQSDADYNVSGNNLYARVGEGLYTHDGKNFFSKNFEEFETFNYRVKDGFIATMPIDLGHVQFYFVKTDKNVNEISRTPLYESERFFTTRIPVPCYPYYNEYLIVSRLYDQSSYYAEIAIVEKNGGYKLEYTCNGYVLFCYCYNNIILVFTTNDLHVFENGNIKYRIKVPSNIYVCLKMKYERKYVLYRYSYATVPFELYQTTDFTDIEQISRDYIEIINPGHPSLPYVLILNGSKRREILQRYEQCYYHLLDARKVRTQLVQSTMFEDGEKKNFDSLFLGSITFTGHGSAGGTPTRNVYIDNLLFEESNKNYVW